MKDGVATSFAFASVERWFQPMDARVVGLVIVIGGVLLVVVGLLVMSGGLGWFGRLPGDIRMERENVRFYFPIVSMLLVSVVLTVLLALIRRWL
jgi:uncharacterized membrane protein YidH (DUF202 family)